MNNIINKESRLNWIDVSKGIGIILVVFGHVLRGLDAAKINFPHFKNIDKFIYTFHMPLFFCLSGYFFIKSLNKGSREFVISKFSTLLYPYLVWSFIQITIQFLLSNFINGKVELNDVFTFFYPRGQFWFLFALIIFNLINYFFYLKYKLIGIFSLVCLSFFYFLLNDFEENLFNQIVFNLFFFNTGILFSEYKFENNLFGDKKYLIFTLAVLMFISLITIYLKFELNYTFLRYLIAICGIITIITFAYLFFRNNTILVYFGKNSMIIYLMHILCGSGARIVCKLLGVESPFNYAAVGLLIGLFLPIFLYEIILKKYFIFLFKPSFKI